MCRRGESWSGVYIARQQDVTDFQKAQNVHTQVRRDSSNVLPLQLRVWRMRGLPAHCVARRYSSTWYVAR